MRNHVRWSIGLPCLFVLVLVVAAATPGVGQSQEGIPARVSKLEALVGVMGQQIATLLQQVNGQGQQIAHLQEQVNSIANPAVPFNIHVDCGTGQTVANALAQAGLHTGPVDITINGVCREAVVLTRSNTSLRGGAPGSGLDPGSTSGNALEVSAASNVRVYDLMLTGAGYGLFVNDAAHVVLYSSSVVGNRGPGVFLDSSTLSLRAGNTVEGNGGSGIFAGRSRLSVDGSTIANNGAAGIDLTDGSSAGVHATRISGHPGDGISLYFSSTLHLGDGCVLEDNGTGVGAVGASSMVLGDGVVIHSNRGDGIHLGDVSVAAAYGTPRILNNAGWGVSCNGAPTVWQLVTPFTAVTGNAAGQVNCSGPPR